MNLEKIEDLTDLAYEQDETFSLSERLNLNENHPDRALLQLFLEQRLLRYEVYRSSEMLASPRILVGIKLPIISSLIRSLDREDREDRGKLNALQQEIDDVLNEKYQDLDQKLRARTIELAINDLISRAMPTTDQLGMKVKFAPSNELLDYWSNHWKEELSKHDSFDDSSDT